MKQWEKPKLIVLVRGKPEESLLRFCKLADSGADPLMEQHACLDWSAFTDCFMCRDYTLS